MPVVTTECIVLQAFRYGDTSKIIRLLTSTHGLRSVIAKGASRPRSRFGAALEPFAAGLATLYLKDGRELQTLGAFELTRGHHRLGSDLVRFGGASLVAEIVLRSGSEESQPQLFEQVRNTLLRIQQCSVPDLESVILAGVWALVALLGFAPELDTCLDCARDVTTTGKLQFDFVAGGVRCAACCTRAPGRMLPRHAHAALKRLVAGEVIPLARTTGHWRLLASFLDHHVIEQGSLKSLTFLFEALESRHCAS